jgi:sugar lactone lactonase YvrE/DNA-binding IclR family transcriptional regulator
VEEVFVDQQSRPRPDVQDVPGTQALMRGLDVLMAIGMAQEPPRFGDIHRAVNLPKGTLHRLLAALQRQRLIRLDSRTRQYHVGSRVFDLARRTLDQSELIRAAKPELSRVSRLLNRAACLYVRDGEDVFVIDFEDPDAANSHTVRIWPRQSAGQCAAGVAMIAAMSPDDRSAFLRGLDHGSDQDLGIDLTRALGYALVTEREGGPTSVASAMLDADGYPVAAISCPFEATDIRAERLHEAGRVVAEAARRASGNFGMGLGTPHVAPRPEGRADDNVRHLETGRDFMGENPVWSAEAQKLIWLDILAPAIRTYSPASGESSRIDLPEITGGLAELAGDKLILLGRHGIFEFDPATGSHTLLVSPEADKPDNRFNTAAIDAAGNLWAGTVAVSHEAGRGSLYRISPDLRIHKALEHTGLPKNVDWSLDNRTLYYSDGADGVVYAFDFDLASGSLGNRRVFMQGNDDIGIPNGITVDSKGHLWAAMLGGWSVRRFAPDGRPEQVIALPIPMPTNLCFGGRDMKTLFVTSTYLRVPPGYSTSAPLSGNLLAIELDVPGRPARRFGSGRAA